MNGGQSGNAFPACQCICNTQSPDALFAPPPCLRYIRQSIFAKQPETHYAGNDKAAVQKAEKEIVLIDGYVDVGTLNLLAKKNENV